MIRKTKILDAIICEQKSAKKEVITNKSLIRANQNGFNNDVGGVTNKCTAMFDVLASLEEGTKEYKQVFDRIICFQAYQQEVIDSCKGIIPKTVPKDWYTWKEVKIKRDIDRKIIDSDEEVERKLGLQKIGSFKKPYFFIYNYSHVKSKYNRYIKEGNTNCLIKYGISMDELLSLGVLNEVQQEYANYYNLMMPVSMEKSTMNRICWKLEEYILPQGGSPEGFDKEILKTTMRYKTDTYEMIKELYADFRQDVSNYMMTTNANTDKDEAKEKRECFAMTFKTKALELCTNEEELCNITVDLCYTSQYSKLFTWTISGEQIIKNLLKKNEDTITYPILSEKGDIVWLGNKYELIKNEVHKKKNKEVKKC